MGHAIKLFPHRKSKTFALSHTGGIVIQKTGNDGEVALGQHKNFAHSIIPGRSGQLVRKRGILTVTGRSKWNAATINGVLANEKV